MLIHLFIFLTLYTEQEKQTKLQIYKYIEHSAISGIYMKYVCLWLSVVTNAHLICFNSPFQNPISGITKLTLKL